jgi:hypothetical protein
MKRNQCWNTTRVGERHYREASTAKRQDTRGRQTKRRWIGGTMTAGAPTTPLNIVMFGTQEHRGAKSGERERCVCVCVLVWTEKIGCGVNCVTASGRRRRQRDEKDGVEEGRRERGQAKQRGEESSDVHTWVGLSHGSLPARYTSFDFVSGSVPMTHVLRESLVPVALQVKCPGWNTSPTMSKVNDVSWWLVPIELLAMRGMGVKSMVCPSETRDGVVERRRGEREGLYVPPIRTGLSAA